MVGGIWGNSGRLLAQPELVGGRKKKRKKRKAKISKKILEKGYTLLNGKR